MRHTQLCSPIGWGKARKVEDANRNLNARDRRAAIAEQVRDLYDDDED